MLDWTLSKKQKNLYKHEWYNLKHHIIGLLASNEHKKKKETLRKSCDWIEFDGTPPCLIAITNVTSHNNDCYSHS